MYTVTVQYQNSTAVYLLGNFASLEYANACRELFYQQSPFAEWATVFVDKSTH